MKKKFSIVLATILVVCTLAIALVACAPKDPDPFKAESKGQAYDEIWNAWLKTSDYKNGDTLGIDLKVDAKNSSSTDLSVILQAGLKGKTGGGDGEGFCLAVIDNKKKGDLIDLVINKDGLFVDSMGLEKPLKFYELSLPALGVGPNGANDQIANIQNYFSIVMGMLGTDVTIDPVLGDKKTKMYDVEYKFGLDFTQLIAILENPADILSLINAPDLAPIVEIVAPMLKDALTGLNVEFSVKTTGNTQTKVEKPAKNSPKYKYAGGKVDSISAVGSKGSDKLNLAINGLKLLDKVPNMAVPNDDDCVEMSLLKHDIQGNIVMKDTEENIISNYKYQIHLELTANDLLKTIMDTISGQNPNALVDNILKSDDAKLFIEVYHECGETCQIRHTEGLKSTGSVLAIAYSPAEDGFDNNRIYVSLNIRAFVPDALWDTLYMRDIVGLAIPKYVSQLSIDPFTCGSHLINSITGIINGGQTTNNGVVNDNNAKEVSINDILADILAGIQTDGVMNLPVQKLLGMLDNADMDATTLGTIKDVVNCLLPNVETLSINAVYTNGMDENFETFNVKDKYFRQTETIDEETGEIKYTDQKNFGAGNKTIIGEADFDKYKDDDGNIKFYYGNGSNAVLHPLVYDADGNLTTIAYEDVMGLIDITDRSAAATIKFDFTDTTGRVNTAYADIVDIVGLDANKIGVPQNITLVLSARTQIGSNINSLLSLIKTAAKGGLIEGLDAIVGFNIPEFAIDTTVTIDKATSIVWDQSKVEGITDDLIAAKHEGLYANGDSVSRKCNFTITYADGTVKSIDVEASTQTTIVNSSNKILSWKSFKLEFLAFGAYSYSIDINMDDSLAIAATPNEYNLELVDGQVVWTLPTSIVDTDNKTIRLDLENVKKQTAAFQEKYEGTSVNLKILANVILQNGSTFTFTKAGKYEIVFTGADQRDVKLVFNVTEAPAEE